ncbi:GPI inositol-deacylase [Massilia sp. G4R7]|uniref:GPI inositol-deacylase n=1 Tax=Massilia phyllostachyos TaxID=2898585 RepID=A0ABS8Q492_9BURK|nr:GPI inositol-deacylase [Massilia phyllostachyos]MCD2516557.1 GPI inositol-deacylase [Massilia phyllostachyos]
MSESTRPLPSLIPLSHGGWQVNSFMSSVEYTLRGLGLVPPDKIIPVIVVPGIMGTNLRARQKPRLGRIQDERNQMVDPGQPVWRPPNGDDEGLKAAKIWGKYTPRERQLLFDAATLEVDPNGPIVIPKSEDGYVLTEREARERGWGELHADSYGGLLYGLQTRLNQTFGFDEQGKKRFVQQHWKDVMACDPQRWGLRHFAPLTEDQLVKHAQYYFPVYATGYLWLQDCKASAELLEKRILEIIRSWQGGKRQCSKVILVTHSMGGLVARACARRIPDKIAGIIHGVMPALGAPVAYRRLASGMEPFSLNSTPLKKYADSKLATILGNSADKTTPVLAVSPGALELLPNHLYPHPWLHVRVIRLAAGSQGANQAGKHGANGYQTKPYDALSFPNANLQNPYDLYRDMNVWFRLVNPDLADPADKYSKDDMGAAPAIKEAINTAEKFHRELGDYYHPNTYSFHGDDKQHLSYGQVRWVALQQAGSATALTPANLTAARYIGHSATGQRRVLVEGKTELRFAPDNQDARGDGTVPHQSGAGPAGKVKQVFATEGYDHQGSYNNEHMLMLTLRLITKIVQEIA